VQITSDDPVSTICSIILVVNFRDPGKTSGVCCCGILHGVAWRLVTDVAGKYIGSLFEGLILNTELTMS
jgi:hypothetical protein